MEIKLKSELFKSVFNSETVTKEKIENRIVLPIVEDKNSPRIKGKSDYKAILEDYAAILSCNSNFSFSTFSNLPKDLLKQMIKIGLPACDIRIMRSQFDFSIFDSFEDSKFADIKSITFADIKGKNKKSKFKHAKNLKELTELSIYDCANLDIDSFFEDLPEPDKLDSLTISGNLPSKEMMSRFKNIKDLRILNISNSQDLIEFLDGICLESLTHISFTNCNLENMPESLILRLSSLSSVNFTNNREADYNKILSALPNKSQLESIFITGLPNNKQQLDIGLLNQCNLEFLHLDKIGIDFDLLWEFLKHENKLNLLRLRDCGVENLDFLSDARSDVKIEISQEDIDFNILTPEIARRQSSIELKKRSTSERIKTFFGSNNIDVPPTLKMSAEVDSSTLEELSVLISDVDEICNLDVIIEDSSLMEDAMSSISNLVLENSDKIPFGYSIIVPSFSLIDNEKLEALNTRNALRNIKVMDLGCDDPKIPRRFSYNPRQYKTLKETVEKLTHDIPEELPELEKFMIIYRRLGASISYDYGIIGDQRYSEYAKKNFDDCRNSVNGLLKHTCVCAGFADILYNCLREIGIEAYKISGVAGDYHQWNKVKIDGKFYNVDLTWDIEILASELPFTPTYCLLSDEKFKRNHRRTDGESAECLENYDRAKLREALIKAMEFDGIKPKSLFTYMAENIKKEFMKLFPSKKDKALPPPSVDTAISQTKKDDGKTDKKPSWDLGEDTQEVKKKMAAISLASPTISHNTDRNIDFDD